MTKSLDSGCENCSMATGRVNEAERCPDCQVRMLHNVEAARYCPHCRACWRAVLIGFLIPVAIWIIGVPFEGRYATPRLSLATAVAAYYDAALVGVLIGIFAYAVWLIWYAVGLRWRMAVVATLQILCCAFVVVGDFLWSAGPL